MTPSRTPGHPSIEMSLGNPSSFTGQVLMSSAPSSRRKVSKEIVNDVREQLVAHLLTYDKEGMGFDVGALYRQYGKEHMSEVTFKNGPFHAAREILLKEHKRAFTPRTKEYGGRRGWLFLAGPNRAEQRADNFGRAGVRKLVRTRDYLKATKALVHPLDQPRIEKKIEKYEQNVQSGIHKRIHKAMQPKWPAESPAPPPTPGKR